MQLNSWKCQISHKTIPPFCETFCSILTGKMAWGYWSATTVSDRGRSPRRNQNGAAVQTLPVTIEDRPSVSSTYSSVNSNNNTQITEFDVVPTTFSRRPSLDLSLSGPQSTLAGIICAAHGSRHPGGTLSAGNTLTRMGSRHTAVSVEYAVPHHLQYHSAYVDYHHQQQLSFSDDDSSSEPGYATGTALILFWSIFCAPFSLNRFRCMCLNRIRLLSYVMLALALT